MEIIYGQELDNGHNRSFLKATGSLFNTMILGPTGLLSLLERELNLTGITFSSAERRIQYRSHLADYFQKNPGNLFETSFQYDPEGVTKEMLHQRDQLVLAGWTGNDTGISARLDFLAAVEKNYQVPAGVEDRWIKVISLLETDHSIDLFIKFSLMDQPEAMHPFFCKLFVILESKKCDVSYRQEKYIDYGTNNLARVKRLLLRNSEREELDVDDHSFRVLNFRTDTEATEFIAAHYNTLKNAVIINRNNHLLDEMLNSFGYPVSGSMHTGANTEILQLFKLVTCLLTKPVNVYNLLSYLQVVINPVPGELRTNLMWILVTTGGIRNEYWYRDIKAYLSRKKENAKRVEDFTTFRDFDPASIPASEVVRLYIALEKWAMGRFMMLRNDVETPVWSEQLAYLAELCRNLVLALTKFGLTTISLGDLSNLVGGIYESFNTLNYTSQAKSLDVVALPGNIIGTVDKVVWLDCYNEEMKPRWYDFLNNHEMTALIDIHRNFWRLHEQTSARSEMLVQGVLKAKLQCILITVNKSDDSVVTDHPLLSFLKARVSNLSSLVIEVFSGETSTFQLLGWEMPETVEAAQVNLPGKEAFHTIGNGNLIPVREKESASSIEKMITYPFDWVLQYACKIEPANSFQLNDISKTQGNVAHKFIELLFKEAENDLEIADVLMQNYEKRLEPLVEQYGCQLLLDEHKFEYISFSRKLRIAINNLIDILRNNRLEVTGTETEKKALLNIFDGQEVDGKVDLIVKTQEGSSGIIDLKWTRKSKKFLQLLRENRHLQLAVYKELLTSAENCHVKFVAYYSLAEACLYTPYALDGINVVQVYNVITEEELLHRVKDSIDFRRQQFNDGVIEEGEGMELEELNYSEQGMLLYPLEEKDGIKKANPYSNYASLKGEES